MSTNGVTVHKAIVHSVDATTGICHVKIPAVTGQKIVRVGTYGLTQAVETGLWNVPHVGALVLVGLTRGNADVGWVSGPGADLYLVDENYVTTSKLKTNAIKSINYLDPTVGSAPFSVAGTFLDLANGNIFSPSLALNGSAGTLEIKGAISGGTIDIGGFDSTSFHVDAGGTMWLGAASAGSAPFSVTSQGILTAASATLTNASITGAITGGTIDIGDADATSFHVDAGGNMWMGAAASAGAPFKVTAGGAVTASNLTISGGSINLNGGVFSVTSAGAVTASNMTISGGSISLNGGVFNVTSAGVLTATGANITGTVNATAFYLKDGANTRGSWVTDQLIPEYGTLDGIEASLAAGSTRSFLAWRSAAADYKISLVTSWSGGAETHVIGTDYNGANMTSLDQAYVGNWAQVRTWKTGFGLSVAGTDRVSATVGGDTVIDAPTGSYIWLAADQTKMYAPAGTGTPLQVDLTTNQVFSNVSRRALKEQIAAIDPAWASASVDALNPVSFVWRAKGETSKESEERRLADVQYGFIAEEVAEADERLALWDYARDVNGDPDGTGALVPGSWNTNAMIALSIAELKALRARVADLESMV